MAKKQKKLDDISKKFGDEREKALNDALKLIEKDFGKGSIMRLGERAEAEAVFTFVAVGKDGKSRCIPREGNLELERALATIEELQLSC